MKLTKVDPHEFSDIVSNARGQIIFTTEEGDRLVSGSLISTLVGLANLVAISSEEHVEITCEDENDRIALERHMARFLDN